MKINDIAVSISKKFLLGKNVKFIDSSIPALFGKEYTVKAVYTDSYRTILKLENGISWYSNRFKLVE